MREYFQRDTVRGKIFWEILWGKTPTEILWGDTWRDTVREKFQRYLWRSFPHIFKKILWGNTFQDLPCAVQGYCDSNLLRRWNLRLWQNESTQKYASKSSNAMYASTQIKQVHIQHNHVCFIVLKVLSLRKTDNNDSKVKTSIKVRINYLQTSKVNFERTTSKLRR